MRFIRNNMFSLFAFFIAPASPFLSLLKLPVISILPISLLIFLTSIKRTSFSPKSHSSNLDRLRNVYCRFPSLVLYGLILSVSSFFVTWSIKPSLTLISVSLIILVAYCAPNQPILRTRFLIYSAYILSIFCVLSLVLSYIFGFTYAFSVSGERIHYFIPFSFSAASGDLLQSGPFRPSAIYDEPGAFLFIVILISSIDILNNGLKPLNFLLAPFAGICSTSLSGLIVPLISMLILLFIEISRRILRTDFLFNKKTFAYIAFLCLGLFGIFFLLLIYEPVFSFFDQFIFSRFTFVSTPDGLQSFAGDNRSTSITSSVQAIKRFPDLFWVGQIVLWGKRQLGEINTGGDPFTVLIYQGAFNWLFYLSWLLLLLRFVVLALRSNNYLRYSYVGVLIFVLLLLRPHTNYLPYLPCLTLTIKYMYDSLATPPPLVTN